MTDNEEIQIQQINTSLENGDPTISLKAQLIDSREHETTTEAEISVATTDNDTKRTKITSSQWEGDPLKIQELEEKILDKYSPEKSMTQITGITMYIDDLGFYYIQGEEVEDEEKAEEILSQKCVECGEKFEHGDRVYFTNQFDKRYTEYCKSCMKKKSVTKQL